jgi:hypothetical protein
MNYIILKKDQIGKIDFSKVLENENELKYSANGTKTYVSWNSENPPEFIEELDQIEGPLDLNRFTEIMYTHEWMVII